MDKLVPAHDEIRHLLEVDHYEVHAHRTESEEFKKVKKGMHDEGLTCFINNGKCDGQLEIHHGIIEYSAASEVDWNKVNQDYPNFKDVDGRYQMVPLCEKHHRRPGFGVHYLTEPIWRLQKYMNPEALEKWEKATLKALEEAKQWDNQRTR